MALTKIPVAAREWKEQFDRLQKTTPESIAFGVLPEVEGHA
jgi:hypothetical protein